MATARRRPASYGATAVDYGRPPAAPARRLRPTGTTAGLSRSGRLSARAGGYPDQGYGGQSYGRQDTPSPTTAATASRGRRRLRRPGYARARGGGYDYGQPAGAPAGGYGGGYGQGDYPAGGAAVTLQLDDGSGRTYQLREGANVIGRGQDAQFRLPDTGVSRRHLEIRWDGQVALLSDLNSTNGTTVNNAPVQEWQLADGDVIRLGHSEIIVRVH